MRSISLIPQILLEVESCNFMWEVSGGYYRLVNLRKSLVKFAHFRQGVRSVFFCVVNLSIVAYNLRTFRSGVTIGGGSLDFVLFAFRTERNEAYIFNKVSLVI